MNDPAASIGFLVDDPLSAEQGAALEWAREAGLAIEQVSLEELVSGAGGSVADVLWWHRRAPLETVADDLLDDCQTAVQAHLEAGGGLVLSLRALEAVRSFGIDPVTPDVTIDDAHTTTGLLCKSLFREHPLFDGFDGLRVRTCEPAPHAAARYEWILPERGEVLASTLHEEREAPYEVAAIGWRVGDGDVLGLGDGIRFDDHTPHETAANRSRLLENAFAVLARDNRRLVEGRPKSPAQLAAARVVVADDPNFPRYHLTPPANWLNDPNGMIKWDGTYHAFYQYNPGGPYHRSIHWGHAVSDDLVTWEDRPVALTPSPDGPDREGCWSGCAIDADGTPVVVYTGGRGDLQLPCVATATDDSLDEWTKAAENPIIDELPQEPPLRSADGWAAEFRDHSIWREGDTWHHLIGSGVEGGGGTALLYTSSDDVTNWTYRGPILVGDPERDGEMWECPELLDLGEKQLLHVSNYEDVRYFLGTYDPDEYAFDVEETGLLDYGHSYAPQSMWDPDGNRWLSWGWLKEGRPEAAQWDAGWSGAMGLPRAIDLDGEGRIRQRPPAEIAELRERQIYGGNDDGTLELVDERRSLDAGGRALEISVTVRLENAEAFELVVREAPGGEERTPIRYTRSSEIVVDRGHSSTDHRAVADAQWMPVTPIDDSLDLRVFLDGSVLEVFANDRHCLTSRIYPTRADSTGVSIAAEGGTAVLEDLSIWGLGDAWRGLEDAGSH